MKRRTNPSKHPQQALVPAAQIDQRIDLIVRERLPVILENQLPEAIQQVVIAEHTYSGPLPPPADTEHYERILNGFTDRWVTMSEREQSARHNTTVRRDWMAFFHSLAALLSAFSIVLLFLGAGVFLLVQDKTVEGFTSIGIAIATILGGLVYRSKSQGGKGAEK